MNFSTLRKKENQALLCANSKTSTVTPFFNCRIVISMIRCTFWQSFKTICRLGSEPPYSFKNLKGGSEPRTQQNVFKLIKKLHLINCVLATPVEVYNFVNYHYEVHSINHFLFINMYTAVSRKIPIKGTKSIRQSRMVKWLVLVFRLLSSRCFRYPSTLLWDNLS